MGGIIELSGLTSPCAGGCSSPEGQAEGQANQEEENVGTLRHPKSCSGLLGALYGDIIGYLVRRSGLRLESRVSFHDWLESIFPEFSTSDLESTFIIRRLH